MACNNTTYMELVANSTELQQHFHRYAFFVENLNHNVPVAMLINKCITPIWILIGVFGNIVSAITWASPRMRTCNTVAYYLTCLAIADLLFLLLHLVYELQNPWLLGTLDFEGWCQLFAMANIGVQYFCVFLVFAFTVERFLSVCHPFKSERFSKTRTPRIIFGLFILAVVLSLPQGYFWVINLVDECQVRPLETLVSASFYSVYTWCTELAVFLVLPLLVLILNVVVIHRIRSVGTLTIGKPNYVKKGMRTPLTPNDANTSTILTVDVDANGTKRLSRTNGGINASNKGPTVTLLWVSFYLIFTVLPNTIVYAMQPFIHYGDLPCAVEDMSHDPTWQAYFSFAAIKLIVKELSLSHHVGNIFIYMATSRRFLQLTLQILCPQSKHCNGDAKDTTLHTLKTTNSKSICAEV